MLPLDGTPDGSAGPRSARTGTTGDGLDDAFARAVHTPIVHTDDVGDGALPTGTVTFLLTDVEGSTRLWHERADDIGTAIQRHYEVLDEVVAAHGGVRPVEQGEGDSIVAAFAQAAAAVAAASTAQRRLQDELPWLPVRMAIHSGDAVLRDEGNYVGRAIIRCARIRACGHGGQVLVSDSTVALARDDLPTGVSFRDLGTARLRDMTRPERVWQVVGDGLRPDFPPLRSLETTPHNLPLAVTSLIGRRRELDTVGALLAEHRVVTLTGAGGCGKTRLALHAAGESVDRHSGGVWWVELAPVTDGANVAERALAASGRVIAGGDAVGDLAAYLGDQGPVLLVLDNAEHVVDAVATVIDRLVQACPKLTVLVTSREPVGVVGEAILRVPSLITPTSEHAITPAGLLEFEATRLFVERARAVRPNLALADADAELVTAICRRLDGVPLALELAAARVRSMSLERLASGLDDAFRVLTGGARTVMARQQTLQASIAWSYDLLDAAEQAVLRRLSVFQSSFVLDAAEHVAADGDLVDHFGVLDTLARLVDKSLVQFDDDTNRYRLLETIRQFAAERLGTAQEIASTRSRHCAWYERWSLALAADELGAGIRPDDPDAIEMLAAQEWAFANDPSAAHRLITNLAYDRTRLGHAAQLSRTVEWLGSRPADEQGSEPWARAVAALSVSMLRSLDDEFEVLAATAEGTLADSDPSAARMLALWRTYHRILDHADRSEARRHLAAAVADSDDLGVLAYGVLVAQGCQRGGELAELDATLDTMRAFLRSRGSEFRPETASTAYGSFVEGLLLRGRLREAKAIAVTLRPTGHVITDRVFSSVVFMVAQAIGDPTLVYRVVIPGVEHLFPSDARVEVVERYEGAVRAGDDGLALNLLREAVVRFPTCPAYGSFLLRPLVVRMLQAGLVDELEPYLSRFVTDVERIGRPPLPEATRLHIEGLLARFAGDEPRVGGLAAELVEFAWRHELVLLTVDGLELLAESLAATAPERAARLAAAATVWRAESGYVQRFVPDPSTQADRLASLEAAQPGAWAEGATLSLVDVVAFATRGRGERGRPTHGWDSLTPTEVKVVQLVAEGLSNDDVARRLLMSPATVKTHLTHVYAKTGTANRNELSARFRER